MTTRRSITACLLMFLLTIAMMSGCSDDGEPNGPVAPPGAGEIPAEVPTDGSSRAATNGAHATGEVQLVWQGNAGGSAHGDSIRIAVADFALHAAGADGPARGEFSYRVESPDGTAHRIVTATVDGVVIDAAARRVWFTGVVTADTKGCGGGPGGSHADGCSDTGGCTDGHDDGHDGGCTSGDHDDGGCADGGTDHDDGGCPDGTHEDGGCPEGSHDTGGAGGPSGATGRSCRIGQVIVGKAHDGGTPALDADGITWKWFLGDDPNRPDIADIASWPHLCRKTITGGNLMLHLPGDRTDAQLDAGTP